MDLSESSRHTQKDKDYLFSVMYENQRKKGRMKEERKEGKEGKEEEKVGARETENLV